jgi:hypothetical protein
LTVGLLAIRFAHAAKVANAPQSEDVRMPLGVRVKRVVEGL